jgi:hypothetical protein
MNFYIIFVSSAKVFMTRSKYSFYSTKYNALIYRRLKNVLAASVEWLNKYEN